MATASLPQDPDLDQLRTQARELQRAVRRGDPDARERVTRWHPAPPPAGDGFPLTAAQLVLARQHGFPSWARVRRYVEIVTARAWAPDRVAAARLLAGHPELPEQSLLVAAACADVTQVRRHLADRPGQASVTGGPWHRLLGESLESPAEMLRSLLAWAVSHDQRARVALLAAHGVDVVSPFTEQRTPRRGTPVKVALANGHRELAGELLALGARPPRLSAAEAFAAAVLAGDAGAVRGTPAEVVAAVRQERPGLVTWAAAEGAPGAVELLAAAGFDVNALGRSDIPSNAPWHTALHVAAEKGDVVLARTLLELGAGPDIADKHYRSTPLGWARHFGQPEVAELLEPLTGRPSPD